MNIQKLLAARELQGKPTGSGETLILHMTETLICKLLQISRAHYNAFITLRNCRQGALEGEWADLCTPAMMHHL